VVAQAHLEILIARSAPRRSGSLRWRRRSSRHSGKRYRSRLPSHRLSTQSAPWCAANEHRPPAAGNRIEPLRQDHPGSAFHSGQAQVDD